MTSLCRFSRNSGLIEKFPSNNADTEFHENPTNILVPDTRSHSEGQTDGCGLPRVFLWCSFIKHRDFTYFSYLRINFWDLISLEFRLLNFKGKTGCCLHVNYEAQKFRAGTKHTPRCLRAPAVPQVLYLPNFIHLQNVLNYESSRQ